MGFVACGLISCTSSTGSTQASDFSRVDDLLRLGDRKAAISELQGLASEGSKTQRAQASLMLCESSVPAEQAGCYRQVMERLAGDLQRGGLADFYALATYRFLLSEPLESRVSGFKTLSLQCPGTPGGLKAVNYLKGHWGSLEPRARLRAWSVWVALPKVVNVADCQADTDPSQVTAIVGLERARAHLELEEPAQAAQVLESIWPQIEKSVWWDDVAMAWADALYKNAKALKALEVLALFTERRESSFFIGSYESVYFDDALMMRGDIFRSMKNSEKARDAYLELIASAPESRLCDDAAYQAARLLSGEKQIEALGRFLETYPNSKWVPQIREFLGQ